MIKSLFFLALGFMFLSSSTSVEFGLQEFRMIAFSIVFISLLLVSFTRHPFINPANLELPIVLAWFLAIMAVLDLAGTMDPLDYKLVLPILAIAAAPHVGKAMAPGDLPAWLFSAFSVYILAVVILYLAGTGAAGTFAAATRIDPTGSVVSLASAGTITAVLATGEARRATGFRRIVPISMALLALAAIFATATRTAVATMVILGVLLLATSSNRSRQLRNLIGAGFILALLLAIHTIVFSDVYFLRLTGNNGDDYSSGRWHSLAHWLAVAADSPLGQGIGSVREIMLDGRPGLSGGRFLEWPHNEFVRFYVEGGIPGLMMISLLVGGMTVRALRSARKATDPRLRMLVLALAADMLAQSLLQNHFNMIYHSSMTMLILAMLTIPDARVSPRSGTADRLGKKDMNERGGSLCRTERNLPSMT